MKVHSRKCFGLSVSVYKQLKKGLKSWAEGLPDISKEQKVSLMDRFSYAAITYLCGPTLPHPPGRLDWKKNSQTQGPLGEVEGYYKKTRQCKDR
jgi:hypothetical protein